MCPHYGAYNKECKLYGTSQSDDHIRTYCITLEFGRCANYEGYGKPLFG